MKRLDTISLDISCLMKSIACEQHKINDWKYASHKFLHVYCSPLNNLILLIIIIASPQSVDYLTLAPSQVQDRSLQVLLSLSH